ncbi:MAG: hypothetical protein WD826_00615 [Actinomycetota bacterium]
MTDIHRHRIRSGIVAVLVGALGLPVLAAVAPLTASAKPKCTQKITGPNNTNLHAASGEMLCLKDAQQTGDITVDSGGKLKVVRSTVNGAITLANGFTKFKFCKSEQIGGAAISATGGTKPVLIGGTKKCRGNMISGVVNLNSNGAGVKMGKNQIDGAVNADSNQAGLNVFKNTIGGVVTLTANLVKTRLSGNQIGGALNCSTNDPPPTNGGSPNTVVGARSGQSIAEDF